MPLILPNVSNTLEVLCEHFSRRARGGQGATTKAIVFTQLRATVREIVSDLAGTDGELHPTHCIRARSSSSYFIYSLCCFIHRPSSFNLHSTFPSHSHSLLLLLLNLFLLLLLLLTLHLLLFTCYCFFFFFPPLLISGVRAQGFIGQASKAATGSQEALKGLNQKEQAAILQATNAIVTTRPV